MNLNRLKKVIGVRGQLSRLAEAAGVKHSTILKIATGKTRNPGYLTVERITRALDEIERAANQDSPEKAPVRRSSSGVGRHTRGRSVSPAPPQGDAEPGRVAHSESESDGCGSVPPEGRAHTPTPSGERRERARRKLQRMQKDGLIRPGATLEAETPPPTGDHE